MKKLCVTVLYSLFCIVNTFSQNTHQIDSLLEQLYHSDKLNGNVLVAVQGKVMYKKSFGLANVSTKEKLNENSIFELASLSKQFTAMGIMILKEQRKLKVDDTISMYLPELSFYKGVTIRHLLNHTSGLPDYLKGMDSTWDKSNIATNKDVIAYLSKYHPNLLFEPNTKFDYCNTGYVLLASIIERCSHESYGAFLKKSIFDPLKMKNTFVYNRRFAPKSIHNYAYGYQYSEVQRRYVLPDSLNESKFVVWLDGIYGDGAVNSTIMDLFKWDRALHDARLVSALTLEEMFSPAIIGKIKTHYGYGWELDSTKVIGKMVYHYGGWPGYASYIERDLDHDKTIIILTNHYNRINYISSIQAALYKQPLPKLAIYKEIFIPADSLQKFTGTYDNGEGFKVKIFLKNGLLYERFDQTELLLTPKGRNSFFIKVFDDTVVNFDEDEKGKTIQLHILERGENLLLKRVPE
jgi:CubicO group peptidase (beta-lactamase class C family)